MKKIILTFGFISGAIMSGLMVVSMVYANQIGFDRGLFVGYTTMVLSFLLVFFGIRAYRDQAGGGITFGRAFAVGMAITLISCAFYVVTWEILYRFFMPDFMDKYGAYALEKARASGASAAALAAKAAELQKSKESYSHVLVRVPMTFIEPFPVGLLITLISAFILKRENAVATTQAGAVVR